MVRFVLLNPDGDCSDVNMPLKCKELEKPISTIIKKRVKNQKALVDVNEPKMVVLIMNYIINKGGTKLEEIAKWKLDDGNSLMCFGFPEKKPRKSNKPSKTDKTINITLYGEEENMYTLNGHELPPNKNAANRYYGDILMFKVNDKLQILDYSVDDYSHQYETLFFKDELGESDSDVSDDDVFDGITEPDNTDIDDELDLDTIGNEPETIGLLKEDDEYDEIYNMDYGEDMEGKECEDEIDGEVIIDINIDNNVDGIEVSTPKDTIIEADMFLTIQESKDDIEYIDDEEDTNSNELVEYRKKVISMFIGMIKNKKMSHRIEASIFDNVIATAKERKIIRKWDSDIF